jgi:hypothetical protein
MQEEEICDVYTSIHVIWEIKGGVVPRYVGGGDRKRGKNVKE